MTHSERFQSGESLLHRLDPRIKVVVTAFLLAGILILPEKAWPAIFVIWGMLCALARAGDLNLWQMLRLSALALPFTLAAATLPFTMPGTQITLPGGLAVSVPGLIRFFSIVLKSWLSVQVVLILSYTTHFTDLLWTFAYFRVPRLLIEVVGFMYRYLALLQEEAERLLRARAARSGIIPGQRPGGSLLWRARIAGYMVGSLFLRSYERSERVYAAMLARGYTGQMRTYRMAPLSRSTILMGAFPLLVLLVIEISAVMLWSR